MSEEQTLLFPDPRQTLDDGLLCVGGNLQVRTLFEAYRKGIFPWPQEGYPLLWFSPVKRGVLDFEDVHFTRRFLRELHKPGFTITFNRAFSQVIQMCAKTPRSHEKGTWISDEIIQSYIRFHEAGYAHSVECWLNDQLVGGMYGVYVEGVFSGESMFYQVSGASKRCLYALIEHLKSYGIVWMDIQMVTPHLQATGGKYVERDDFLARLQKAKRNFPEPFAEFREERLTSKKKV